MKTITTGEVRFSYANVFTPRANDNGGEPKYSITLLIPKTDVNTYNAIQSEIKQALQEGISKTFGGTTPALPHIPFYDGDGVRPSGEPFGAEAHGHWVITANSKQKPQVVDENVQAIIDQNAFYSGCYGRASINFFTYSKAGKKGVGCGLGNVQKLRDGVPLAGRTTAAEDFAVASQMQQPPVYQPPQQLAPPTYQQPAPTVNPVTGLPYSPAPVGSVLGM